MSDKVKERIEREAQNAAKIKFNVTSTNGLSDHQFALFTSYELGHATGATAERPKAWNEAIDACILVAFKDDGSHWIDLRNKLEALKHKQP